MNAAKSIEREMQRQRSFQIIPLLRKRTRQLVSRRIMIPSSNSAVQQKMC